MLIYSTGQGLSTVPDSTNFGILKRVHLREYIYIYFSLNFKRNCHLVEKQNKNKTKNLEMLSKYMDAPAWKT